MGLGKWFKQNLNPNNLLKSKANGSFSQGMKIAGVSAAAPLAVTLAPVVAPGVKWAGSKVGGVFKGSGGIEALPGGDIAGAAAETTGTGGNMGWASKIGGFFKNHGDTVIDGLSLAEGVYQNHRQNKINDRYRALAEAEYARRAPMRDEAMRLMLDDSTPDTSAIFADPMAPGGRYRKVSVGSRG